MQLSDLLNDFSALRLWEDWAVKQAIEPHRYQTRPKASPSLLKWTTNIQWRTYANVFVQQPFGSRFLLLKLEQDYHPYVARRKETALEQSTRHCFIKGLWSINFAKHNLMQQNWTQRNLTPLNSMQLDISQHNLMQLDATQRNST